MGVSTRLFYSGRMDQGQCNPLNGSKMAMLEDLVCNVFNFLRTNIFLQISSFIVGSPKELLLALLR